MKISFRQCLWAPKQAFEVLLNTPEPRRTLTLGDAATALRVSELLGLMWMDLDFEGLVIYVRRAYVWGRIQTAEVESVKGSRSHASAFWLAFSSHGARERSMPRKATMCFPA